MRLGSWIFGRLLGGSTVSEPACGRQATLGSSWELVLCNGARGVCRTEHIQVIVGIAGWHSIRHQRDGFRCVKDCSDSKHINNTMKRIGR